MRLLQRQLLNSGPRLTGSTQPTWDQLGSPMRPPHQITSAPWSRIQVGGSKLLLPGLPSLLAFQPAGPSSPPPRRAGPARQQGCIPSPMPQTGPCPPVAEAGTCPTSRDREMAAVPSVPACSLLAEPRHPAGGISPDPGGPTCLLAPSRMAGAQLVPNRRRFGHLRGDSAETWHTRVSHSTGWLSNGWSPQVLLSFYHLCWRGGSRGLPLQLSATEMQGSC